MQILKKETQGLNINLPTNRDAHFWPQPKGTGYIISTKSARPKWLTIGLNKEDER